MPISAAVRNQWYGALAENLPQGVMRLYDGERLLAESPVSGADRGPGGLVVRFDEARALEGGQVTRYELRDGGGQIVAAGAGDEVVLDPARFPARAVIALDTFTLSIGE